MTDISPHTLKECSFFESFQASQLEQFASIMQMRELQPEEFLFHEGASSDEMYFLQEGELILLKHSPNQESYQEIRRMFKGEVFGEMAFLDGSTRSAALQAARKSTLWVLSKDALAALPTHLLLEKELVARIARVLADRLRGENESLIASFESERKARKRQYEFGTFFVYVQVWFAIGILINYFLYTQFPHLDRYNDLFTWGYLGILLVPALFLVWELKIPLARIGLTLEDWKQSATEGIVVSVSLVAIFAAFALVCYLTGWLVLKAPNTSILKKPEYFLHSFGQEFLARGLLQNSLQRFFVNQRGHQAVFVSSVLFALLHIHFGLMAVAITLFSSIFMGFFYLRHRSLLGVTILHWSMGVGAFLTGII